MAWIREAALITSTEKLGANQGRQNNTPVMMRASRLSVISQKIIFWPKLYLPTGKSDLISPRSMLPAFLRHSLSLRLNVLYLTILKNMSRKPRVISTPKKGCRIRVHVPPPNKLVRKNSDGWKKASPDNPDKKNIMAINQWFIRSLSE